MATQEISNGSLNVDGARLDDHTTNPDYNVPQVLEFRATFANAPSQSVGLGNTFEAPPYATFTTGSPAGLLTRTLKSNGGIPTDTDISSLGATAPHLFRIEWNSASKLKYFVDDQQVNTPPLAEMMTDNMRPVISDFTFDDGAQGRLINLGAPPPPTSPRACSTLVTAA